jgi:hypothetical protein
MKRAFARQPIGGVRSTLKDSCETPKQSWRVRAEAWIENEHESFEEIGSIVECSPAAKRQLASRARRRVHRVASAPSASLSQQREVIDAFLTALRAGDIEGLMVVLDPDLVVHAGGAAARAGAPQVVRGAQNWAKGRWRTPGSFDRRQCASWTLLWGWCGPQEAGWPESFALR